MSRLLLLQDKQLLNVIAFSSKKKNYILYKNNKQQSKTNRLTKITQVDGILTVLIDVPGLDKKILKP